jgi:hypothetical protein
MIQKLRCFTRANRMTKPSAATVHCTRLDNVGLGRCALACILAGDVPTHQTRPKILQDPTRFFLHTQRRWNRRKPASPSPWTWSVTLFRTRISPSNKIPMPQGTVIHPLQSSVGRFIFRKQSFSHCVPLNSNRARSPRSTGDAERQPTEFHISTNKPFNGTRPLIRSVKSSIDRIQRRLSRSWPKSSIILSWSVHGLPTASTSSVLAKGAVSLQKPR